MEFKGFMGSFFKVSEWIMKFLMVNIIWLLFNSPLIYLILSMLFVKSTEELYMLTIIVIVLLPFIFFPATTAMFAIIRRWILKKDDSRLIPNYWKYYKENYVRSLLGGIVLVILWGVWIMNYNLSGIMIGSGAFYIYFVITVFFITFTNYFFADTVHFELKLFHSLRKTLFTALFNVHYTISATGVAAIAVYIIYQIHPIILILFSGSIIAIIYFFAFYQIYLKAQGLEEAK